MMKNYVYSREKFLEILRTRIQQCGTEMRNKNQHPTIPALQKRRCGPFYQIEKGRMGRPCVASRWKCIERSIDIYEKRKEAKGKTTEKMEGYRQGNIRRNWRRLGTSIQ